MGRKTAYFITDHFKSSTEEEIRQKLHDCVVRYMNDQENTVIFNKGLSKTVKKDLSGYSVAKKE